MIPIFISNSELKMLKHMADKASIGGISRIRNKEDRLKELTMDQLIGQLGTYAFLKYWTGRAFCYEYLISRYYANLHPDQGDGGSDVPAANIDVKTSYMRASDDPSKYRLLVRPSEKKNDWIYVLALVEKNNAPITEWTESKVALVGWATSDMLPSETASSGIFSGAFVLDAIHLQQLMPIKYLWK